MLTKYFQMNKWTLKIINRRDTICLLVFPFISLLTLSEDSTFFSIKGQVVSILGFVGYMVSVANIQLCLCSPKVATDNM